jgi:hypothetical protein
LSLRESCNQPESLKIPVLGLSPFWRLLSVNSKPYHPPQQARQNQSQLVELIKFYYIFPRFFFLEVTANSIKGRKPTKNKDKSMVFFVFPSSFLAINTFSVCPSSLRSFFESSRVTACSYLWAKNRLRRPLVA